MKKLKQYWIGPETEHSAIFSSQRGAADSREVILVGAPDDRGVMNVGGRIGTGHGPKEIRKTLGELSLGKHESINKIRLLAGHDISLGEKIEDGHRNLRTAMTAEFKRNRFPVVLGGGHDYGFPHLAGAYDEFGPEIAVINVDAHLDLRVVENGVITSGSPFYMAIEAGCLKPKHLAEFGIQDHCNDWGRQNYADKKGVKTITLNEAREESGPVSNFEKLLSDFQKKKYKIVVSFDLDAVIMSSAPGVSAAQPDGFSAGEFLRFVELAGLCPSVISVGFFEVAPPLDEGMKTVKLTAVAIHRLITALSLRAVSTTKKRRMVRVRSLLTRT